MQIREASFIISNTSISKCPEPDRPEYAFIGRSNVGKSSLINMLTDKKGLAKTSQTPGKTQLINHFLINGEENKPKTGWYLVDLPGYGYAKVSKQKRSEFKGFILTYLEKRENLMCVLVLVDSRLDPQKIDLEFMEWLGKKQIPFVMVFTKADKLSKTQLSNNLKKYQQVMLKQWEEMPQYFLTSAESGMGREELLSFIGETNLLH